MNNLISVLPLIGPQDNVGSPAIPDQVQDGPSPNQNKLSAMDGEKFKRWRSAASTTAKLLLRGTKESADAFPPLKSVVGGLCFILDNYEVLQPFSICDTDTYRCFSKQMQTNKR